MYKKKQEGIIIQKLQREVNQKCENKSYLYEHRQLKRQVNQSSLIGNDNNQSNIFPLKKLVANISQPLKANENALAPLEKQYIKEEKALQNLLINKIFKQFCSVKKEQVKESNPNIQLLKNQKADQHFFNSKPTQFRQNLHYPTRKIKLEENNSAHIKIIAEYSQNQNSTVKQKIVEKQPQFCHNNVIHSRKNIQRDFYKLLYIKRSKSQANIFTNRMNNFNAIKDINLSLKELKEKIQKDQPLQQPPQYQNLINIKEFNLQNSLGIKIKKKKENHQILDNTENKKILFQNSYLQQKLTPFVNYNKLPGVLSFLNNKNNSEQQNTDNAHKIVEIQLNKHQFIFQNVIGKGGFGKVWRVFFSQVQQEFALKEMSKSKIITKKSVHSVLNERVLLSDLQHEFLANMHFAFQDRENLYLCLDLLKGGDLRFHLGLNHKFSEEQTKFFVCNILIGLSYLHENGIIHRDIKPENLILDEDGYIRITDLGISRRIKQNNKNDTSGTPGYMAPEVMCRQNHSFSVDFFAIGVIIYECMLGKRPYIGRNRKEIRDAILSRQIQVKDYDLLNNNVIWSQEGIDFTNKILQRKPRNRLGNVKGIIELKNHVWLRGINWDKMQVKKLKPPYLPDKGQDNFDKNQILLTYASQNEQIINEQNKILLRRNSIQQLFEGYFYSGQMIKPIRKIYKKLNNKVKAHKSTN